MESIITNSPDQGVVHIAGWSDATSAIGVAFVQLLENSPGWALFSFLAMVLLAWFALLSFKVMMKKLDGSVTRVTEGIPVQTLIDVVTESTRQANISAAAIVKLSEQVETMAREIKALNDSVTRLSDTVRDIQIAINSIPSTPGAHVERREVKR